VKPRLRTLVLAALRRAFFATNNGGLRQAIFRQIRRLDHADDSVSRALMKEYLDVDVGRMTYGAYKVDGSIAPGTRIGSFCSIAPDVRLGGSDHPLGYVSTHPFQYLRNRGYVTEDDQALVRTLNQPVVIEDDVWLCDNVAVLCGVTIGRGAAVGAGAVVTTDIPPYSLALGVPARVVRTRLPEDQVERLMEIDWPSWDDDTIRERVSVFSEPEEFIRRFGTGSKP
jgi:acetyltransferase-like isoleucine patch superfamily enzyme